MHLTSVLFLGRSFITVVTAIATVVLACDNIQIYKELSLRKIAI